MTDFTFHIVAAEEFLAADQSQPYTPIAFADDGFVHCTNGIENAVDTANRYMRDDARPYLLLALDVSKLGAPVRNDDASGIYPHVYGPIERAAIISSTKMPRDEDGQFLRLG